MKFLSATCSQLFFLLVLVISGYPEARSEVPQAEVLRILQETDQAFRSSQRHVSAQLLWREASERLTPELRAQLYSISQEELLQGLRNAPESLGVNRGVVENLLKIHQINFNCATFCKAMDAQGEYVEGLPKDLDPLVLEFAAASEVTITDRDIDFNRIQYEELIQKVITDNDLYNVRMAAGHFALGHHENTEVTYTLFSRGKKDLGYLVSLGQEQILYLLENLRFTEAEVRRFQEDPEFSEIPKEFWDYLRNFQFRGSIEMMPVGTVVHPDEPVMVFRGNPIETQLIETVILPIMNYMSAVGTAAVRATYAANGKPVAEGGTRRSPNPILSSLASYLGGAVGTSNSHVARILRPFSDIKNFGTMAHSWIGQFESELEAFLAYSRFFHTQNLVDTYDLIEGTKVSLRAGGENLQAVRLDSTLEGSDKGDTADSVRKIFRELGFHNTKIGYSDSISEFELQDLQDSEIDSYLLGTNLAVPKTGAHGNFVYKLVEVQRKKENGEVLRILPMKLSNGKKGIPGGDIQVFRYYDENGIASRDVIATWGEALEGNPKPLLVPVVREGERVGTLPEIEAQREYIQEERAQLPEEIQSFQAKRGDYPVSLSPVLLDRQNELQARYTGGSGKKVGVFFGSFSPVHEGHEAFVRSAKLLYSLDEVIVVPTGAHPVHGKRDAFSPEEKFQMLETRFSDDPNISVSDLEVAGKTRFAMDTLREIESRLGEEDEIYLMSGVDNFSEVGEWREGWALANNYHWIVASRDTESIRLPKGYTGKSIQNSPRHFKNDRGKIVEWAPIRTVEQSSSKVRASMESVTAIFHEVDLQDAFFEANGDRVAGPLGIPGSSELLENIEVVASLAFVQDQVKKIASQDSHLDIELVDPKTNGEFHGEHGFPPHAMENGKGSLGDQRLREVEQFPLGKTVVVPHHGERDSGLYLRNFNFEGNLDRVLRPDYEIVLKKNGPESYNVWNNPRTEQVYQALNPNRDKPIYVYGVATDFCVRAFAMEALERGYPVVLVTDAIMGIFDDQTQEWLQQMRKAGAQETTTDDLVQKFGFEDRSAVLQARDQKSASCEAALSVSGDAEAA